MHMQELFNFFKDNCAKHGISGWKLVIDRAKSRRGQCRYGPKEIGLSAFMLNLPDQEIKNTILHEIAHILTPGHGHDNVWKQACLKVGAIPKACRAIENEHIGRTFVYPYVCNTCGFESGFNRKPKHPLETYKHNKCGGTIRWKA